MRPVDLLALKPASPPADDIPMTQNERTDKTVYGSDASDWTFCRRDYNPSEGDRDQWHAPGVGTVEIGDDGTLAVWGREEGSDDIVLIQVPAPVFRAIAERRLALDLDTINDQRGAYGLDPVDADLSALPERLV